MSDEIRVIAKAIAILRALAGQNDENGMSLGTIASTANINKATCHRILATLSTDDFVERTSVGHYKLGIGVFTIGAAVQRNLDVRERALPILTKLHEDTDETIYLCVRRGYEAVCIDRISGKYAGELVLRLGGSLPLHVGGAPRVLLAGLSDAEVEKYIATSSLVKLTENTRSSRTAILQDVAEIRKTGGSISNEDVMASAKAFGAPVFDHEGQTVAAVSLSGIVARIPPQREGELFTAIRAAGHDISAAMGFAGFRRRNATANSASEAL